MMRNIFSSHVSYGFHTRFKSTITIILKIKLYNATPALFFCTLRYCYCIVNKGCTVHKLCGPWECDHTFCWNLLVASSLFMDFFKRHTFSYCTFHFYSLRFGKGTFCLQWCTGWGIFFFYLNVFILCRCTVLNLLYL